MARDLKLIVALAGLGFLAACDTPPPTITPVANEPDIVTVKLALAAEKAAKALDVISGIEQARNPNTPPMEDYSNAPANLMQPVSLRWSGPLEKVTKALADRAGMRFHIKGAQPAAPLIVNVDAYQQPILHVLHDLGLQAGRRADIAVDGAGSVIEIRFALEDTSPSRMSADKFSTLSTRSRTPISAKSASPSVSVSKTTSFDASAMPEMTPEEMGMMPDEIK